jgi:hypothetical protein
MSLLMPKLKCPHEKEKGRVEPKAMVRFRVMGLVEVGRNNLRGAAAKMGPVK